MHIPFHRPYITEDEINSVVESLRSGWTTMGHKTFQFEEEFAEYIGLPHAIAVNSCTAALHCALIVSDIEENDEVIIPADTFVATAEVVEYCKARPVLVDIERDTHNINPERIIEKVTARTKAIIPVHFAGQPCDMDSIKEIAKAHNISIIEDAAHALPAWYKKHKIGTISDITCFSFYATKTLATGEGGMIVTNNEEWAEGLRIMRLHGMSRDAWKRYSEGISWEYDVTRLGFKYNTSDIFASIGIEQLKRLEWMHEKRSHIAKRYDEAFQKEEALIPYSIKDGCVSAWHLYPLKLNLESLSISRDRFIDEMYQRGVHTSVHFIPVYRFSYYNNYGYLAKDFPESEWVFHRVVSLPIYPGMTDEEINYVIEAVLDIISIHKR
jgi:dTDP-4-amino-4,6-dideoxygalactose transaminase